MEPLNVGGSFRRIDLASTFGIVLCLIGVSVAMVFAWSKHNDLTAYDGDASCRPIATLERLTGGACHVEVMPITKVYFQRPTRSRYFIAHVVASRSDGKTIVVSYVTDLTSAPGRAGVEREGNVAKVRYFRDLAVGIETGSGRHRTTGDLANAQRKGIVAAILLVVFASFIAIKAMVRPSPSTRLSSAFRAV